MDSIIIFSYILIILLFTSFLFNIKFRNKSIKLESENKKLNKENKKLNKIISKNKVYFSIGDKCLLYNYGLKNSKTNKIFNVDYECVVEEVSQLKIKVKAIDCVTDSANINNKKIIIDFMKDRWVNKSDAELIMNISQERNNKLDKILN